MLTLWCFWGWRGQALGGPHYLPIYSLKKVWLTLFMGMKVGREVGFAEVLRFELVTAPPKPTCCGQPREQGPFIQCSKPRRISDGRGPPF